MLGFGQSALSQYLGGKIPLNGKTLMKFCGLIGADPAEISPSLVADEVERAATVGQLVGTPDAQEAAPATPKRRAPLQVVIAWPFEDVKRERWDRLTERQKGRVESAMLAEIDAIERNLGNSLSA